MKVKIIDAGPAKEQKGTVQEVEMRQSILIPQGKDIYIHVPEGVYRCNINEGSFPRTGIFFMA